MNSAIKSDDEINSVGRKYMNQLSAINGAPMIMYGFRLPHRFVGVLSLKYPKPESHTALTK
jgi:hypothetical protein